MEVSETIVIAILACLFQYTEGVVPSNIPLSSNGLSRNDLIKTYFMEGLKYVEIIMFLMCKHKIHIGLRQLKRILRSLGLQRRPQNYSPIQTVVDAIKQESSLSGECVGYRNMWKRLVRDHGLIVKRNEVMKIMKRLFPCATEERRSHRLKRRVYTVKGPNYVWHVDGYDKLKPFGFCIHGCIDGYSRRIMWLEVASTNNNPAIIAKYYLDCVKYLQCTPRILRADMGTENSSLSFLQPYFRYFSSDSMAGSKSFLYGKSVSNQRIEAWWNNLRKLGIHWWINLFKDIRDSGLFDIDNIVIKECLRFCFMDALQTDLDRIASQWNSHDIRQMKRYTELPSGKPDVLYFVPELTNGHDFRTQVDTKDVDVCASLYGKEKEICSKEFKELVNTLRPGVVRPVHPYEALKLFIELNNEIQRFI